jgi:phage shock protein A
LADRDRGLEVSPDRIVRAKAMHDKLQEMKRKIQEMKNQKVMVPAAHHEHLQNLLKATHHLFGADVGAADRLAAIGNAISRAAARKENERELSRVGKQWDAPQSSKGRTLKTKPHGRWLSTAEQYRRKMRAILLAKLRMGIQLL